MAQFYEMPAISPTMEVGTLVAWRVKEGEAFQSSAVLAEIGTDKANMEAEIFDSGVLLKQLLAEGDEAPPGFPIAIWGQAGEDISELMAEFERRKAALGEGAGGAKPAPAQEAPRTPPPAQNGGQNGGVSPQAQAAAQEVSRQAPARGAVPSEAPEAALSGARGATSVRRTWEGREIHRLFYEPPGDIRFGTANGNGVARVAASPLARKVAAEKGIELRRLTGTGPGGRITVADVAQARPAEVRAPAGPGRAAREDEIVRNTPMRKTIARRLTESHQQIPTFFLTAAFDGQGMVEMREDLKKKLPDQKISYNDILVMAVARALHEHPQVNASWGDKEIVRHGRVDVGIAVALPEGLITPVLRNADQLKLSEIAQQTRELAGRARAQKLQPEEYTGGTFTISNLGMYGIEQFTAIINPPEAGILAVGALEEVPLVKDGNFVPGWRMKVTMTCDHRVVDGAVGAEFLQTVRRYVESPWLLLV